MGNFCGPPKSLELTPLAIADKTLDPLIGRLTVEELQRFMATSEKVLLRAGAILVTEGDVLEEFYFVARGSLALTKNNRRVRIATQGECIGVTSFAYGEPQQYTIKAIRRCIVQKLKRLNFDKITLAVEKHFEAIELLNILSDSDRKLLYQHAQLVRFVKGERVVMQGERANQFYIILEGRIVSEKRSLGRGQIFGEDALMENNDVYFSDAVVKEDALLLAISAEGFQTPEFAVVRESLGKQVKRKRRRRNRSLEKPLLKPKEGASGSQLWVWQTLFGGSPKTVKFFDEAAAAEEDPPVDTVGDSLLQPGTGRKYLQPGGGRLILNSMLNQLPTVDGSLEPGGGRLALGSILEKLPAADGSLQAGGGRMALGSILDKLSSVNASWLNCGTAPEVDLEDLGIDLADLDADDDPAVAIAGSSASATSTGPENRALVRSLLADMVKLKMESSNGDLSDDDLSDGGDLDLEDDEL